MDMLTLERARPALDDAFDVPARFVERARQLAPRRPPLTLPPGFRRASVTCLFWPERDRVHLLLTERASKLGVDGKLLALPGGKLESGETALAAALRELQEEVGVEPERIEILGTLDDVLSVDGFVVTPFVAWCEACPTFVPDPREVLAIRVVDVARFLDTESHWDVTAICGGGGLTSHYYESAHGVVWGMAATVIHRLVEDLHDREPVGDAGGQAALNALVGSPPAVVMRMMQMVLDGRERPPAHARSRQVVIE
jgi:8-oxo-dGTP pyrophosphatase MutT (NUDIX family)